MRLKKTHPFLGLITIEVSIAPETKKPLYTNTQPILTTGWVFAIVEILTFLQHMKNNTVKAVRATITLGDVELNVFQLPCGKYQISQSQACDIVSKPAKRMVQLSRSEAGQSLLALGFEKGLKTSVEGSKPVTLVSIEVAFQFWVLELAIGNTEALALVLACGIESIERRADAAFRVVRTEQERNERFAIRRDGIVSRNFWTDCIDAYMATHDVSDNYKRWIYVQVSDMVNKAILGVPAKAFRESLGLPESVSTRDYLTSSQLRHIRGVEEAAAMRCKRDDLCPKQALKDVISLVC